MHCLIINLILNGGNWYALDTVHLVYWFLHLLHWIVFTTGHRTFTTKHHPHTTLLLYHTTDTVTPPRAEDTLRGPALMPWRKRWQEWCLHVMLNYLHHSSVEDLIIGSGQQSPGIYLVLDMLWCVQYLSLILNNISSAYLLHGTCVVHGVGYVASFPTAKGSEVKLFVLVIS